MKNLFLWVILAVLVIGYFSQEPTSTPKQLVAEDSNLVNLVDADVSFTGQDKYVAGTSTTSESVRIFRYDGTAVTDLGAKSLNSGLLSVKPESNYKFFFYMNGTLPSSNYYVDVQEYTGKVQDAVDNLVGIGCSIDTSPNVVVRNSNGNVQSATANAQSISASQSVDVEIDVKSHIGKCYGTPDAPKGNAICFAYNTAAFSNVKPNTKWISVPASVSSLDLGTVKCYEFDVLENGAKQTLTVTLQSVADPTTAHNISIYTDDIAFDLNLDTLEEIWDFTDESGNELARNITSTADGHIYVS